MIPKVIHYCWFGRNPKSKIVQRCMESWKQYCPDYEIIEWNEDNFDVNGVPYSAAAYADKKWAFVSDYARLKIVYDHGGIYMDTDVLLHNSIDELLKYKCWLASDDIRYVATGLGFGACKGNRTIQYLLEGYATYIYPAKANVDLDTARLHQLWDVWSFSEKAQMIDGTYVIGRADYSKFARHLYTNTGVFLSEEHVEQRRIAIMKQLDGKQTISAKQKVKYKIGLLLRRPKMIAFIEKRKSTFVGKALTFLIYDLVDSGPVYFIKLAFMKLTGKIY